MGEGVRGKPQSPRCRFHVCPPSTRSFMNGAAMWSSIGVSVMVVNLIATASAHRRGGWDWVSGLPSCWGSCLDDNGCNSRRCQLFQVLDGASHVSLLMRYQVSAKQVRMTTTSRTRSNAWCGRATRTGRRSTWTFLRLYRCTARPHEMKSPAPS